MRLIGFIVVLFLARVVFGQSNHDLPVFLSGTWKTTDKDVFEHWDVLNDVNMKGFSYFYNNQKMVVTEYMDISIKKNNVNYTAFTRFQNTGKGIEFKMIVKDSACCFVNPKHDYPNEICYKPISETTVFVRISGENKAPFTYTIEKVSNSTSVKDTSISNPNFDKELADKLEGDDYGMKNYYFVILKTGPNTTTDKDFISECFKGHMENMGRLVEDGKLIVAGPFGKNDDTFRGLFILNNLASIEEAIALLDTDPAIKNGLLEAKVYKWYGSAALPEYLPLSDKIWKAKPF